MADTAKEAAVSEEPQGKKKGKGKLLVIVALVLVLAGGGFFMMKGRGAKKEAPKIELAEKEVELEEFLSNMADGSSYLRAKIALKLRKDYTEEMFNGNLNSARNAVLTVLRSTTAEDLKGAEGLRKLRRRLASAINEALPAPHEGEEDGKDKKKDESSEPDAKEGDKGESKSDKKPAHPDWDSETGPVMQVFFSSIATQ